MMHRATSCLMLAAASLMALALAAPTRADEPTKPKPKSLSLKDLERQGIKIGKPTEAAGVKDPVIVYVVQPEGSIFPSLVISQATIAADESERTETDIGDLNGLMGVGIVNPAPGTKATVTISAGDVLEASTITGTLAKAGETYTLTPKLKWKYKELVKSHQQMPVDVAFKVKLAFAGTTKEYEHTRTVTLRTIHDCPLGFLAGDTVYDTHWCFAAYVNEDHPWVDTILKEALATGVVENFLGYQASKPGDNGESVLKQSYAIWRALQTRGITYSDISIVSAANSDVLNSQHVRFLDECIENKQANCIDGTVMMASILRKIGINSRIVFVPGHAFLAIDLDREGKDMVGLETTLLGKASKEKFERTAKLRKLLEDNRSFDQASWETFDAALRIGSDRLKKEMPKLTSEINTTVEHWLIDVGEARRMGVRPIPYVKGKELE